MVQRRQHLRLAFEAREPLRAGEEGVGHDLDGDIAAKLHIACAIHLAHAARAEEREDFVRSDLAARERPRVLISQDVRGHFFHRRHEKPLRRLRVRQQALHFLSQRRIASACRCHVRRPIVRIALERGVAQIFNPPPSLGVGHVPSPSSSRSNQSFASRQSRLMVSGDT